MGCSSSSTSTPAPATQGNANGNYPKQSAKQPLAAPATQSATQPNLQYPSPQPQINQPNKPPPQQQQTAPPPVQDKEDKIETEVVTFNEELIKRWIEMEKEIKKLESKNAGRGYQTKLEELTKQSELVATMDTNYQELEKQTQSELQDVENLENQTGLFTRDEYEKLMAKEKEEYVDALNKQESAKKDLEGQKKRLETLRANVEEGKKNADRLKELYTMQDTLMASVFNGKYGSELEFKLESDVDLLLERKNRVMVAKYKWQNARTLMNHAANQLNHAVRRWATITQIHPNNAQAVYQVTAETRNNLIAASQNIQSAQRYLHTIKFPYCTPAEVKTLDTATMHIFSDVRTRERHQHAWQCYDVTRRRAAALIQWIDQVVNGTILKDLANAAKITADKERALKKERMRLIQEKIKEAQGSEISDEYKQMLDGLIDDTEEEDQSAVDQELENFVEADKIEGQEELGDEPADQAPTPLPLDELAPPPSEEFLFGNIEELKKKHDEDMKKLDHNEEVSKARADEELQAKLAERRSRRKRMQLHSNELNKMV